MLTPEHLAECLAHLSKKGAVVLRLTDEASLEILDKRKHQQQAMRRTANQRCYIRRKLRNQLKKLRPDQVEQREAIERQLKLSDLRLRDRSGWMSAFADGMNVSGEVEKLLNPTEKLLNPSVTRQGKDKVFRGITWRDVPGRDEAARKTTFWLISHGDWRGYKSCQFLEGDALKAAFAKITESQKAKSHKAAQLRTENAQKRNESQA